MNLYANLIIQFNMQVEIFMKFLQSSPQSLQQTAYYYINHPQLIYC